MISRPIRFFIGCFLLFFVGVMFRMDVIPFIRLTEGVLTKAEQKFTHAQLSRSQKKFTYQAINIEYRYQVNQKTYIGKMPYFNFEGWKTTDDTVSFLSGMYEGQKYTIWYDSREPHFSWLYWDWLQLFCAMFVMITGIVCIWSAFWKRRPQ
jgi:Protein of unknown function (DUF3592)